MKGFDIAVVGGGVIGLTLARALLAEGARVAVVDAGELAPAASQAAAGMLAPSFEYRELPHALGEALYRFGAQSLTLWRDYAPALEEETGVFIDYRATGMLGVAYDEKDAAQLREQAAQTAALGGAAEIISGAEAREMEPALSASVVAALHAPGDAQVDPRRLLAALRASLSERRATAIEAKAVKIQARGGRFTVTLESGEEIMADKVALASGAVGGLVPRGLVFPVKGEATAVAMKEGLFTRVIRAPGAYLCPKAEGRLVIGATEEKGREDLTVAPAAVAALRASAAQAVPALDGAAELERWAGLRPGTPDGAPILGPDAAGRHLALGHYRNGVLHAPVAAAAMAALMLGRRSPVDIGAFGPERFTAGQDG